MPTTLRQSSTVTYDSGENPSTTDRLTWIVELMSRYASEKCHSHDSVRLAAAIVSHLNSLSNAQTIAPALSDAVSHWLEVWDPILERDLCVQQRSPETSAALYPLVRRARFA